MGLAPWRGWVIGATITAVAALAIGIPAIADSDWVHTHYQRATSSPSTLPDQQPSTSLQRLWSTTGTPPATTAVGGSSVISADQHTITGRDPKTGAVRWSYERSNADICSWTVLESTVVVLYKNGKSCSDIDGFDADSGRERWYLNADLSSDARLFTSGAMFYALTKKSLQAFYLANGNNAWVFDKSGCEFTDARSGSAGMAVIANCQDKEVPQLIRLDGGDGKQSWQIAAPGTDPVLFSSDQDVIVLSTLRGKPALSAYAADGKALGSLNLPGAATTPWSPATAYGNDMVGYAGGRVVAVDTSSFAVMWSQPATGPAAIADDMALVPTAQGLKAYQIATGIAGDVRTADGMPAAVSRTAVLGPYVVVTDADHTAVYG
jgi:hypothetical protein